MTNRIALIPGLIILAAIAFDLTTTGGGNLIFLGKKLVDLIEWLAFWR